MILLKKQFVAVLIIFSFFVFPFSAFAAGNCTGYAWGENVGWANFNSTYGQATVANAGLTGYIWLENVGWIHLDYDGIAGATNTTSTDWGVTNDGAGNLGGYAWGENIGWINFHSTYSQVIITAGSFSGYAWSENIGWIKMDHAQTASIPTATWGTYYSSGALYSVNLAAGLTVNSFDYFGYNATIPANTTLKVMFSQDNTNWYSANHTIDTWTNLQNGDYSTQGSDTNLNLSGWTPSQYFYYQIALATTDTSVTPTLTSIGLFYNTGSYAAVSTSAATNVAGITATGNGNITSIGNSTVTERGFQYGIDSTYNSYLQVSETGSYGTGTYSLTLPNLYSGNVYYVRSFVTNTEGRAYGSWQTFTTNAYYNASGTLYSTNLLSGLTVNSIDSFYTLATVPSGTTLVMQFSQDNTNWYSAAGVLNETTAVPNGTATTNLSAMAWTGANFYYKITFTSNTAQDATPTLSQIDVNYNSNTAANQKHFRIYNDDGNTINNATALANEDTNYSVPVDTNFRIRFEVANTGAAAVNIVRRLEFREYSGGSWGAWTQITTNSNNVRLQDSANFTDGDATTSRLTASGTFIAGQGKDTGSDTSSISLANGYYVEDEYSLKFQAGASENYYEFRITNAGVALDSYSVTPSTGSVALKVKGGLQIKGGFKVK